MRQETHVAKQPACPVNGNKEDRSSYVFRGRTLGEMLHSPNGGKAVSWRPLDNMLIKAFLAHGEHDYSSIKTADLTRLAR
ncbi:hypothetical protein ColLi_09088 [Colletotrichum liriopes]|uniref:Uncharacterized protein n=1 Tax=Colletotrichum liriopes TaxID=708192 RepID=A0AA37GT15_9PEZI|nr:hypothetical protein ColLi_09088 [Colletotrichum liriopes]